MTQPSYDPALYYGTMPRSGRITAPNHANCRICHSPLPPPFLDLGHPETGLQPLANNLPTTAYADVPQYPLRLTKCTDCHLVQLDYVVPADELFAHYLYTPDQSQAFKDHFKQMAADLMSYMEMGQNDFVVDVGSNSGLLLSYFQDFGITKVRGVEPAGNLVQMAVEAGVPTHHGYFTPQVAENIVFHYGKASLITATNVFAHVDDIHEFMKAVDVLLTHAGLLVIEVPGLLEFLRDGLWDTTYSEHRSYWSLYPMITLFGQYDMKIVDFQSVKTHGGSMRVYVGRQSTPVQQSQWPIRQKTESKAGLQNSRVYTEFAEKVAKSKEAIKWKLLESGTTCGYSAPAKATVLINALGLDAFDITYIVDDNPAKVGRFIPGTGIEVVRSDRLDTQPMDRAVIFAWNIAQDILPKLQGKVHEAIVPLPTLTSILLEVAHASN